MPRWILASRLLPLLASLLATPPVALAAESAASRPSVLLVVIDTLRRDAVSAYGAIEGTTPNFDALAREGLLYRDAYAPAPWTLPSHATLLSGLPIQQHRTGMPGRGRLPDEIVTLAERLAAAGYETAAFSENAVVGKSFGLLQGFQTSEDSHFRSDGHFVLLDPYVAVPAWLARREPTQKPLFVFVNLLDAHAPYDVREENPYVDPAVERGRLERLPERPHRLLCGGMPPPADVALLRGLYHGDVRAADAKLGVIRDALLARSGAKDWVTIVTSDHGEHFGEDDLLGHEFGLHAAVLRIPLLVHGLPGIAPAAPEAPVTLGDIAPSILHWTGVKGAGSLPGRRLPERESGESSEARTFFAAYNDAPPWRPESWDIQMVPVDQDGNRQFCRPTDRVWGPQAALIRHPFKFRWFERYPAELYDLSWDLKERSDLAKQRPDLVESFGREIEPLLEEAGLTGTVEPDAEPISEEAREALRALGYLED